MRRAKSLFWDLVCFSLMRDFEVYLDFSKAQVNEDLGLVFGWGIVCTEEGVDYFDLQDDHITEKAMLEAATDFIENSRVIKDMHTGEAQGVMIHSLPATAELQRALGISCSQTGWIVGVKPSPALMEKCRSGEHSGFSIGGFVIDSEEVE